MKKKINGVNLVAGLSTMKVDDVPVAPGVDVNAIKGEDKNPMEVVVEVPATKSKRGWNYKPKSLQDIVTHVMTNTLNGFLGHQKPENVDSEFPDIQTHWIGALWDEKHNKAYFRGIIDPSADKLKRWIKAKRVKQVSIFGRPTLKVASGEVDVVGYKPLSIDWTPLDRPGMPTQIVAVGEMSTVYDSLDDTVEFDGALEDIEFSGELDGSYEDTQSALRNALKEAFGEKFYVYIRKTHPDHVIAEVEGPDGTKYYKVSYGVVDNKVTLGDMVVVERKEVYEPVGEMNSNGGEEKVDKEKLLAELKAKVASGEIKKEDLDAIVGEMFKEGEVSGEIASVIGEMSVEDIKAAIEAKKTADAEAEAKVVGEMVDALITEKVKGESAQKFVKDAFITSAKEKDVIAGELDTFLGKDSIKNTLSKLYNVTTINHRGNTDTSLVGVKTKKVRI